MVATTAKGATTATGATTLTAAMRQSFLASFSDPSFTIGQLHTARPSNNIIRTLPHPPSHCTFWPLLSTAHEATVIASHNIHQAHHIT